MLATLCWQMSELHELAFFTHCAGGNDFIASRDGAAYTNDQ